MIKNYFLTLVLLCFAFSLGYGQIATIDFENNLTGYSHTPSQAPSVDPGDQYFHRAIPSDGTIYESGGPYTNVTGSWLFVGSNPNTINSNTPGILTLDPINISGYTDLELNIDFGAVPNDWDPTDELYVEYRYDNTGVWTTLYSFTSSVTNDPLELFGNATGGNNTANGTVLTYALQTITSDNFTGSGTNINIRIVSDSDANYEAFGLDNIVLNGTTTSPCTSPTAQPTSLVLNNITSSSIDGSFTASSADSYLVVASTSATLGANPVDGTTYTIGDTLGSGTVVQSSTATTFSATGLTQNTQYYFFVFAYNGSGCSGGPLYYTTNPLTGDDTTLTGPCLSDNFDSGYGNWTGGSGTYNNGTAGNTGNGIGFNTNNDDIITSIAITDPTSLSFIARASGGTSNYTINFEYATTPTGPWTTVSSIVANGSNTGDITTTANTFNINLNLIGDYYIRILQSPRSGGSFYLDDVEIFCGASTPEPELQLVDDTSNNQNCGYTIDFGNVASDGSTADLTFNIDNIGSLDLNISSLGITGDYTIVSPATPFTIAAGSSETVTVRFAPSSDATLTGVLTINSDDADEATCEVNLTGVGFTPSPEIDVERDTTFASIANGSAANTGNNTIFAATEIGTATPALKSYYIRNEGSADLNVTSISSSNTAEFSISTNPAPITLIPGDFVQFDIEFSPINSGTRTGTIIIVSDDSDENPYTFGVQGEGVCAASSLTFSPASGPVGTIVNVSASNSNFGASTTATINGIAATVTVISISELEVTIPAGATTGNLEINDDLGCPSSELFTVIDQLISSCEGNSGTTPSDLFISEITDHGTGSHSYVEIYNGTGASVDLTDYEIRIHNNGNGTATNTIPLIGTLVNNEVFVLAFGSGDSTTNYATHGYDLEDNATGINDNDNIRLYYAPTNTLVDLWGDTTGTVFTISSDDYTYRRKNTGITAPSTTWNDTDWDSFTPVDYSDIGFYDFSTGTPPTVTLQPVSTPFDCTFSASYTVAGTEGYDGTSPADTQELAYQWFYNAPGTSTWTEILAGDTDYAGQQSATLTIADTSTFNGYQYYCQLREDTATCFTASNAVKLEALSSIWDGSNWSTPPSIDRAIIIDGDYDTATYASFSGCSLIVNAGYELQISNGTYIEIENDITADGDITVFTAGAVVQNNDLATVTANGTITVQKETSIISTPYQYTYWSSPVVGETVENVFSTVPVSRRFVFNAANFVDELIENANTNTFTPGQDDIDDDGNDWQIASGTMLPGVGYAATASTLGFLPANQQFPFVGAFNNGVITPTVEHVTGSVYSDWNFIGNPYPSAIDTNAFFSVNSGTVDTIYLWSHATPENINASGNEGANFSASDYAVISGSGVNVAGGSGVIPNDFVPSGQGFFIETLDTSPITFNNSMRAITNNDQFFRSETTETSRKVLWLNLSSDNGVAKQIAVAHLDGATDANDGSFYDVTENKSSALAATIYSTIFDSADEQFVIQGKNSSSLDLNEIIPLGFKTSIDVETIYTISIAQFEGDFYTNNPIYIKDNLLNTTHDLKIADYNFTSETGVFNNRFEIVFTTQALSIEDITLDANSISIVEVNDNNVQFKLNSKELSMTNIEILDVLGRRIYNLQANSTTEVYNLSKLSQAAYIAKITLSNGQVISKKAVKRK
ncbi:choice-of-anchor D domain-containing protein [Winogradskyella endarachnes]|uniref:Choice-of-anchor D domain-containing protein n=1 Tax=Winogradskyella endarachnes TaxID=2681965 RepID=A0A6L6U827_9FLAO|nr:choice-of-anchor D domain-containing protein [Winogradskyella endarachnes]MUU78490.1 choice-of-anchor D domain-containing protein [Winogradskyella endarachnes]